MKNCYNKKPKAHIEGIPIFSFPDFYIENYEKISEDHLKHFEKKGDNPFINESHWKEIESSTEILINRYVPEAGSKILDVGVGMGRLLERFPSMQRYGMDVSRGYLKHAKHKGINVCLSLIEDMPYRLNYFDAVVSTDVLEHVLDLNLAVKNILRVLKKDGILIIRVPLEEDLSTYLDEDYPYDLVHLRTFDEASLRLLFEKIFNVSVLEIGLTGYRGGPLRIGSKLRIYNSLVNRFLRMVKFFSDNVYYSISRFTCKPVEINVVIQNSPKKTTENVTE